MKTSKECFEQATVVEQTIVDEMAAATGNVNEGEMALIGIVGAVTVPLWQIAGYLALQHENSLAEQGKRLYRRVGICGMCEERIESGQTVERNPDKDSPRDNVHRSCLYGDALKAADA